MSDFYDSLETRDPAAREREIFGGLPEQIVRAVTAPGWTKHLGDIDPKAVTSRAALAKLPLLRKSDLPRLQTETPPFGGFNVTPPGKAKRLLMSPGPIFEPEGHEADFAGVARAMFAAGFREGQIVLNCFSYHLTPGAWMFESAAEALGCAVIPGGVGNPENAFAVGEIGDALVAPKDGIPIGPVTFYRDFAAKVAAHEIGHLLGGHHHYQECATPDPVVSAVARAEVGACTLMSNAVDFQTLPFSTLNGVVVRGHAEAYADR